MTPTKDLQRRVERVQRQLKKRKLDALIVYDRHNAYYLTGFASSLSYLLITPREALMLVDGRYIEAARTAVEHCEVHLFRKISDALADWQKSHKPKRIGLEGSVAWSVWRQFAEWLPGIEWSEAGDILTDMRKVKSAEEIRRIQASARLNDEVYEKALEAAAPGATEYDIRNAIRREADVRGAQGESFDCIVASGKSGSMPHYVPGPNPLRPGDLLLIDQGMLVNHYCSDMTRVVAIGGKKPPARLARAFEAVLETEQAAIAEVAPGVKCSDLHNFAVDRLKKKRLATYFTHSLGHGVGLEIHEGPSLNASSTEELKPGMVITIEPGVYLPGLGGIRIEDLVVVTRNGARVLSRAERTWRTIPFHA